MSKLDTQYFYEWFDENSLFYVEDYKLESIIAACKLLKHGVPESISGQIAQRNCLYNAYTFWENTAPFFAKYEKQLSKEEIIDIVDFLENNKGFNIKGATLTSMKRAIVNWHEELRLTEYLKIHGDVTWNKMNIPDFEYEEEYVITQLSSAKELFVEGKKQHHCVLSYVDDCVRGKSTFGH